MKNDIKKDVIIKNCSDEQIIVFEIKKESHYNTQKLIAKIYPDDIRHLLLNVTSLLKLEIWNKIPKIYKLTKE